MTCLRPKLSLVILLLGLHVSLQPQALSAQAERVQFNRDIRPLLSDRCFLCHGPDQTSELAQETELRLDQRESATESAIFNWDNVDRSEILARLVSEDVDDQMPPPAAGKKKLTPAEVQWVRRWIEQGASYEKHWAYIPPVRTSPPEVKRSEQVGNSLDKFVLRRLEAEKLALSPPADRNTLLRRVSYDLTGLPPTMVEINAFLADTDPLDIAYDKVVNRLLSSEHYGEQMARVWLDASRYADTSGYQYDRERQQWVWRDWVIHAFNQNMPFDQFTIEQIAGDLLPAATDQTRLATGFNRNHPITIEGGVVDEEYRTEYVIDRVVTTSTVWLGQTFICGRCHDHKYDPISQKDFYQFAAFFNNVPERGLNGFAPKQKIVSPLAAGRFEQRKTGVAALKKRLLELSLPLEKWEAKMRADIPVWTTPAVDSVKSSGGATPKTLEDKSVLMTGKNPVTEDIEILLPVNQQGVRSIRLEALLDPSLTNGSASRGSNGNFVLSELKVEADSEQDPGVFRAIKISNARADYEQKGYPITKAIDGVVSRDGWAVDGNTKPENRTAFFNLSEEVNTGSTLRIRMLHRYGASHSIGRFRLSLSTSASQDVPSQSILAIESERRNENQRQQLVQVLIREYGDENSKEIAAQLTAAQNRLKLATDFPETMVMAEMETPRPAYVLERGEYDKPRKDELLAPGIPSSFGSLAASDPPNRLGLARWMVSPEQPLTARVTVNRIWQQLFGVGLVKTSEDFGAQGEYPSHPELLDWLAVDFMESGWDVKRLLKKIVMSNTYRQSSKISPESFSFDPENRLLSRGPRIRLDGEAIRDSALAVSGLLDREIGGKSVYPYHPEGLWLEVNNRPNYSRAYPHQTELSQQFRRSMYTFWKRTVPPPSAATFDAPSREYCVVRRSRTNTPLQAFVMLHDPQFVEAARHLAARMMKEGGETVEAQIVYGFTLSTSRPPRADELAILMEIHSERLHQYRADAEAADRLLSVGVSKVDAELEQAQLAAFTQVARMLMNLSEFLTKG